MRKLFPISLLAALLSCVLAACSTVQPERSIGRELDDASASLAIKSAMLRIEGYALEDVDVEVTEGVALLTGVAPRDEDAAMAECLAWSSPAVRLVANELLIGPGAALRERANDALVTQRVRARLISDRSVRSVNYNVEAFAGRVYLLGVARSRGELDRAAGHAALVEGVEEVISYVRIVGAPSELPLRGAERARACGDQALPVPPAEGDEAAPA